MENRENKENEKNKENRKSKDNKERNHEEYHKRNAEKSDRREKTVAGKKIDWSKLGVMLAGVIGIGIFQSLLVEVRFGTDTCAFMNLAIAGRVGISMGLCMILSNVLFFVPEVLFGRKLIGAGTLANMLLVGCVSDLCRMLEEKYLPTWIFVKMGSRGLIFGFALLGFLISVALYMNADMGQTPYDAIPTMLSKKLQMPYARVRILWDCAAAMLGVLLGGRLTVGNVILALTIGPAVGIVGKWLKGERVVRAGHFFRWKSKVNYGRI